MTDGHHEFGGPEWIGCVDRLITEHLVSVDLTGITASSSEEFTDPPAHLLEGDAKTIGWHWRIDDGVLRVIGAPLPDAERRVIGDYGTIVAIARLPHADPQFDVLAQAAIDNGSLRIVGRHAEGGKVVRRALASLHDELIEFTA
jgi:hypothetical protein